MTTRHTISHADELYRGNAFLAGYSPDGRRGTLMSNIHVKEYGAVASFDADGIVSSYVTTGAYTNMLTNTASVCKGALVSSALASVITFATPRNIIVTASQAEAKNLYVYGTDEYGADMVETITVSGSAVTSGKKAFKTITKLQTTGAWATTISIGTGNRLGLPYRIANAGKILGVTVDGLATGGYTLVAGHATAAAPSSSNGDADVRGTVAFTTVPDSAKLFTVMMVVDSTSRNTAFGQAQATAVT